MAERPGIPGEPISLRPAVLHTAAIERLADSRMLLDRKSWPGSMYLAGLSVECMLQSFALRSGALANARHDLLRWLTICPAVLKEAISRGALPDFNHLCVAWNNR